MQRIGFSWEGIEAWSYRTPPPYSWWRVPQSRGSEPPPLPGFHGIEKSLFLSFRTPSAQLWLTGRWGSACPRSSATACFRGPWRLASIARNMQAINFQVGGQVSIQKSRHDRLLTSGVENCSFIVSDDGQTYGLPGTWGVGLLLTKCGALLDASAARRPTIP